MFYIDKWIEYYESLFPVETNQKEFFSELAGQFSVPRLLSVECGPALVSSQMAKNGIDVTITDTFLEFINHVNQKMESHENYYHSFQIKPQDIARYFAKNFFNVICSCNYRLIFLKDETLILKLLFDAKVLLQEGGYIIFDLINFSKFDFTQPVLNLPELKCDKGSLFSTIVQDKESASYVINQAFVTKEGKHHQVVEDETVFPITAETLKRFSKQLGFSEVNFYSDWSKTPFSNDSDKIICVFKK